MQATIHGVAESGTTERLHFHFSPTSYVESSHLFLDSILPPCFSHAFTQGPPLPLYYLVAPATWAQSSSYIS